MSFFCIISFYTKSPSALNLDESKYDILDVLWAPFLIALFLQCLSPECSVSAIADIAFLVDGSWSVGRENFKHIRSFIAGLAGAFDIGEDKTRVAVVQYSTDTRTEFPLTRYNRRGDLLQAINTLPYKGGNTMTGKELIRRRHAEQMVYIFPDVYSNLLGDEYFP